MMTYPEFAEEVQTIFPKSTVTLNGDELFLVNPNKTKACVRLTPASVADEQSRDKVINSLKLASNPAALLNIRKLGI